MKHLIENIKNKNYDEANEILNEEMMKIVEKKLFEEKKRCAAKLETKKAWDGNPGARAEKLYRDVIEEDDELDEAKTQLVSMSGKPIKKLVIKPRQRDEKNKDEGKLQRIKKLFHMTQEEAYNQLDENRIGIVSARVRGGKIQRRKRVSNVPGMTIRGGQLVRMSPAERRARKMGAKRAALKKRGERSQIMRKRKMSLLKRQRLGL